MTLTKIIITNTNNENEQFEEETTTHVHCFHVQLAFPIQNVTKFQLA